MTPADGPKQGRTSPFTAPIYRADFRADGDGSVVLIAYRNAVYAPNLQLDVIVF